MSVDRKTNLHTARAMGTYVLSALFILVIMYHFHRLAPSFEYDIREDKLTVGTMERLLLTVDNSEVRDIMRSDQRSYFIQFVFDEYEKDFITETVEFRKKIDAMGFQADITLREILERARSYAREELMLDLNSSEFVVYARLVADNCFSVFSYQDPHEDIDYASFAACIYLLNVRDGSIDESDLEWLAQRRFENRTIESFWVQIYNNLFLESIPHYIEEFRRSHINVYQTYSR